MSEVVERTVAPIQTKREEPEVPPMYKVMAALRGPMICEPKFVTVLISVFERQSALAFRAAERLSRNGKVTCGTGFTREIAEAKAAKAIQVLIKEVDGCACATDKFINFVVEPE